MALLAAVLGVVFSVTFVYVTVLWEPPSRVAPFVAVARSLVMIGFMVAVVVVPRDLWPESLLPIKDIPRFVVYATLAVFAVSAMRTVYAVVRWRFGDIP